MIFSKKKRMDEKDIFEENPIIIGLQIFIFVFLVIAFFALCYIYYSNMRIRAAFKADLPNHLEFFRNSQIQFLKGQDESESTFGTQSTSKKSQSKGKTSQNKYRNILPPSMTPYGTKISTSPNSDIYMISNEISNKLIAEESLDKNENDKKDTTKEFSKPKSKSDLLLKVQTEGETRVKEEKEKAQKLKKDEEEKKRQLELEKEEAEQEKAEKPEQTKKFSFGGFNANKI